MVALELRKGVRSRDGLTIGNPRFRVLVAESVDYSNCGVQLIRKGGFGSMGMTYQSPFGGGFSARFFSDSLGGILFGFCCCWVFLQFRGGPSCDLG